MGKALPMALRERVAAFVNEGHGHREAARLLIPGRETPFNLIAALLNAKRDWQRPQHH